MVSTEMAAAIEAFRRRDRTHTSLAERRAAFSPGPSRYELPDDVAVSSEDANGVPVFWLDTPGVRPDRMVFFVHGGGWVLGDLASHGELAARIGRQCRARVLFINYRLAPEHPFPAAADDVQAAWTWLAERHLGPDVQCGLVGDSAGGNLALSLLIRLRDASYQLPDRVGLMSPVTDLTGSGPSMDALDTIDPVFTAAVVRTLEATYLAGADPRDPAASPLFADLTALPPMLIQTGGAEVLLDDSRRLADAARRAGVPVTLTIAADLPHVYPGIAETPEAHTATADLGKFLFPPV